MLPLGKIGIGFRRPRMTNFTRDEQLTMMTLWSVFRSPLMVGGDLPQNDEWTLSLLTTTRSSPSTSREQIRACSQKTEDFRLWASDAPDGGLYLAGFNLLEEERAYPLPLAELGMENAAARDLWAHADLGKLPGKRPFPRMALPLEADYRRITDKKGWEVPRR